MARRIPAIVETSSDYVWSFKVKLLERLLAEQVEALEKTNRLDERDVQEYQRREERIRKVSRDLGLDQQPEDVNAADDMVSSKSS